MHWRNDCAVLALCLWLSACTTPRPPALPAPSLPSPGTAPGGLRGDPTCNPDEPDCNVCAPDVLDQFEALFDPGRSDIDKHAWRATGDPYPPSARTLHDATHRWWAVPRTHVQGFVRTASSRYPYAISYSHEERGSLLLLSYADSPHGIELSRILDMPEAHPSGLAALGQFTLVAGRNTLHVVDLRPGSDLRPHPLKVKKSDPRKQGMRGAGGGLAAARLSPGRYLVLVATPGGSGAQPRVTRFYEVRGTLPSPKSARYLGEYVYENPTAWETSFIRSENVSLVTECGTGALYAVYTTGDDRLGGEGYARVSRIEGTREVPTLRHLAAYPMRQSSRRCHLRSSATVFVERNSGALRFLCHQRACRGWELELQFEVRRGP